MPPTGLVVQPAHSLILRNARHPAQGVSAVSGHAVVAAGRDPSVGWRRRARRWCACTVAPDTTGIGLALVFQDIADRAW